MVMYTLKKMVFLFIWTGLTKMGVLLLFPFFLIQPPLIIQRSKVVGCTAQQSTITVIKFVLF